MAAVERSRKQLGAWYTPDMLAGPMVAWIREQVGAAPAPGHTLRVLDPACGDGRLLAAVIDAMTPLGWSVDAVGCDIDPAAVAAAATRDRVRTIVIDALAHDWSGDSFDVIIGNPPFLSQMASETTRGGSSRHGGGPYADAAVEFLALAHRLVSERDGVVALVLPQSILGVRDAAAVRRRIDTTAELAWWWWEPEQTVFEAKVNVCVLGWRTPAVLEPPPWTRVVTDRIGVPTVDLDRLDVAGTVGDRNLLNANFRDEYYALVPAVFDDTDGAGAAHPEFVTSGLIDPGRCWWGERSVRFAKRRFERPRVEVARLEGRFGAWAARKLVPKVMVANQTTVVEAVADPAGTALPGVPVTTATPHDGSVGKVWQTAAVLTSPIATAFAWQHGAGTGLSTRSVRVGPRSLAGIPWPAGDLDAAVAALRTGDIERCGSEVCRAYGLADAALLTWWSDRLPGSSRHP